MWFSYTDEGVLELHILREDDEQPEVEDHVVSNDCVLKKFIDDGGNEGRKIKKRYDLLMYDEPSTTKEERERVLEEIKQELEENGLVDYDHEKPELARSESDKSTENK